MLCCVGGVLVVSMPHVERRAWLGSGYCHMCVQCIYYGRGGDGERVGLAYIVSVWKQHILCLLYGLDSRHTSNFDKLQHLTLVTF